MSDIVTVMWKEWKEVFRLQGTFRSTTLGLIVMVGVFGLVLPLPMGLLWITTPIPLAFWVISPLALVSMIIADSIAGERERHTLETLLASRLPDRAILLGKIGASMITAWLITQIILLVALVPVNILHWDGRMHFYRPEIALSGLALSLLLAGLMSTIGVLISLRAATVRQAQQTLGLAIFVLAWALPLLGSYALRYVPEETRARFLAPVLAGNTVGLLGIVLLILLMLNAGLLVLTLTRFQRTKLIAN